MENLNKIWFAHQKQANLGKAGRLGICGIHLCKDTQNTVVADLVVLLFPSFDVQLAYFGRKSKSCSYRYGNTSPLAGKNVFLFSVVRNSSFGRIPMYL